VSNFTQAAYHPREKVVRAANFIDNYFGQHQYGVQFSGDPTVYKDRDTHIPLDVVFVPKSTGK